MKRLSAFILLCTLLFSTSGCILTYTEFSVTGGTLNVESSAFAPKITLVGDDEDKAIENSAFWDKLVEAIDGKPIEDAPITAEELCECALTYLVRVRGNYSSGYYLTLHDHGVEISQYCKYRKCMELLGIVEVDEATMNELIGMLVEV